jgi:hypothetical protein
MRETREPWLREFAALLGRSCAYAGRLFDAFVEEMERRLQCRWLWSKKSVELAKSA